MSKDPNAIEVVVLDRKNYDSIKTQLKIATDALKNLRDYQQKMRRWEYGQKAYITITHSYHSHVNCVTRIALSKIEKEKQ